jgi:hypothetical protein
MESDKSKIDANCITQVTSRCVTETYTDIDSRNHERCRVHCSGFGKGESQFCKEAFAESQPSSQEHRRDAYDTFRSATSASPPGPNGFCPGGTVRSCCPCGTKYILRAEALIKLALMGMEFRVRKASRLCPDSHQRRRSKSLTLNAKLRGGSSAFTLSANQGTLA